MSSLKTSSFIQKQMKGGVLLTHLLPSPRWSCRSCDLPVCQTSSCKRPEEGRPASDCEGLLYPFLASSPDPRGGGARGQDYDVFLTILVQGEGAEEGEEMEPAYVFPCLFMCLHILTHTHLLSLSSSSLHTRTVRGFWEWMYPEHGGEETVSEAALGVIILWFCW